MFEKEMDRRRFLVLASGTVAAVILAGCVRKEEIDTVTSAVQEPASTAEPANSSSAAAAPSNPTATAASPTATPQPVQQKDVRSACPRGLINDPYPGKCKRYVDNNGNGICDLSEV